jgi:hypothetical protein
MQMEPELTDLEKQLRVRFVDEYMYDRSPVAAAMRVGFMRSFAQDFATKFMDESFVRKLIREREEAFISNNHEQAEAKKKAIELALIHEANYRGPGSSHAARVTALTNLAKLYDMDKIKKDAPDLAAVSGVMVVPAMGDVDNWGDSAAEQQKKLKETVRD